MKITAPLATLACAAALVAGPTNAQELFAGSPDVTIQLGGSLAQDADWRWADLDAMQIPEPDVAEAILAGLLAAFTFARRYRRMPAREP